MQWSRTSRAVGLDIGTRGARAVQVRRRADDLPIVERAAWVDLPPVAMRNGTVADPAALAESLRRMWRRGRFATRRVAVNLADSTLLTRAMDLPWMPEADIRSALRYQVQEALPVDIATVELDAHLLAETHGVDRAGHSVDTSRVLVVAAGRQSTTDLAEAIRRARLEPVLADAGAFALIRAACQGRLPEDLTPRVIVDIGAEALTVVVHAGGQPRFVRTIANIGGDKATAAIAEATSLDEQAAERLKMRVGLNGPAPVVATVSESSVFSAVAGPAVEIDPQEQAAVNALGPWATSVVGEIRDSIDYFIASDPAARIGAIVLCGGASMLPGLVERVSTQLPFATHRLDRFAGLPASHRVNDAPPPDARLALAIGLALAVT